MEVKIEINHKEGITGNIVNVIAGKEEIRNFVERVVTITTRVGDEKDVRSEFCMMKFKEGTFSQMEAQMVSLSKTLTKLGVIDKVKKEIILDFINENF